MLSKPNQLIIAGIATVATAVSVAVVGNQFKAPEGNQATTTPTSTSPSSPSSVNTTPAKPSTIKPMQISPPTSGCKISMAIVNDPEAPLNVRQGPSTENKVVAQLNNNTFVSVIKEENGWLQIREPEGWIAKNRTRTSCVTVNQDIKFFPGGNEAVIKGEIIGGGSHTYILNATQGQTLTVKNNKAVFPMILSPDGKLLAGDPGQEGNRKDWSGKLPRTGKYMLELDSNFKGYEYEFYLKLQ